MQRMGSDNLAPRLDERRAFLALDLDTFCAWLAAVDEQDRATFMLGTAWLREELGYFSLVDEQCVLARELGRTYSTQEHPGGLGRRCRDRHPRGRYHRIEPWYVPCSCGSSFMYHNII